jgi:iron complex transport system ATP-binding protein
MPAPLIEFQNVSIVRSEEGVHGKRALDSINFSIASGEHVAILGPNGSGKSTLIKAITRELYPLQTDRPACVRILGREKWNVFELRPHLGIVTNDLMALCTRSYSAREIILSGFFSSVGIWPNHVVTDEMQARTDEVIELMEVEDFAGRNVDELSSGEARRVLIGRALVHRPEALVLDEPTASLDFRGVRELREIMRKIATAGTSIILVTHHLEDIIPEISRVLILKNGRVVRDGAKADVLTSEELSRLFDLPAEVLERGGYYHLV